MKVSDLISTLSTVKVEYGDLDISFLYNNFAYELDPIYIEVTEKQQGGKLLTIAIEDYVDGIKNSEGGEHVS
jgi:hypothetical protein